MLKQSKIQWLENLYPDLSPEDALARAFASGKFIAAEGDTVAGLFAPVDHTATLEKIANFKIRNRDKGFIVLSPSLEAIVPYIDFSRLKNEELVTLHSCGLQGLEQEVLKYAKNSSSQSLDLNHYICSRENNLCAEAKVMLKLQTSLCNLESQLSLNSCQSSNGQPEFNPSQDSDLVNNLFWGLLEFAPYYVDFDIASDIDKFFNGAFKDSRSDCKSMHHFYTSHALAREQQLKSVPQQRSLVLEIILNYFNATQQKFHKVRLHPADFTPYLKPLQEYVLDHKHGLDACSQIMHNFQTNSDNELLKTWGMFANQEIDFKVWNSLVNSSQTILFALALNKWFDYPANPITQISCLAELYRFLDWLLVGAYAARAKIYAELATWRLQTECDKQSDSLYKTISNATLFGIFMQRDYAKEFSDYGITYIFPANLEKCPPQLIGDHDSIAVRFVARQELSLIGRARDTVVLNYVRKYQHPVVTTSVNLSGSKTLAVSLEENLAHIVEGYEMAQALLANSACGSNNNVQEDWLVAFKSSKTGVSAKNWLELFNESFISTYTDLNNTKLHNQGCWIDPSPIVHLGRGIVRNSARLSVAYKYQDIYRLNNNIVESFKECFSIYTTNLVDWSKRVNIIYGK